MATVFMDKIVQKIYDSPNEAGLRAIATEKATEIFDAAVEELKNDFDKSEVTQELDRGVGSPNISETLRGGDATENLYSFIGFDGSAETDEIRDMLDPSDPNGPKLRLRGKEKRRASIRYQFLVDTPNEEAIWQATPMPWAEDMSWAKKIEEGIQGFGSFIAKEAGRSGGGIQAKVKGTDQPAPLRDASYVPPADGYIQTMFRKFLARIKGS